MWAPDNKKGKEKFLRTSWQNKQNRVEFKTAERRRYERNEALFERKSEFIDKLYEQNRITRNMSIVFRTMIWNWKMCNGSKPSPGGWSI